MKRLLLNGAGASENPTPARRSGAKRPQSRPPKALRGLQVEELILKLLQSSPRLRTAAIAKATAAQRSTTDERLKRLRRRDRARRRQRRVASAGLTAEEVADLLAPGPASPCERWIMPLASTNFR